MNSKKPIQPISFEDKSISVGRLKDVSFSVPGKPIGKQRPRVTTRGGFARAYTPKETVDYENLVKISYSVNIGNVKLQGPIKADITAIFPIPTSLSKKAKEKLISGDVYYTKKPDTDNICKSILDALNNIAYDDDSQICEVNASKYYGQNPRTDIRLQEVGRRNTINDQ